MVHSTLIAELDTVEHVSEIAPSVQQAITDERLLAVLRRILGEDCWFGDDLVQSGVVYQDARPGRESGYTRIGWHSATRATDDQTTRRHLRGSYFAGAKPAPELENEFIKNAAR
jgi:hypothetical protein